MEDLVLIPFPPKENLTMAMFSSRQAKWNCIYSEPKLRKMCFKSPRITKVASTRSCTRHDKKYFKSPGNLINLWKVHTAIFWQTLWNSADQETVTIQLPEVATFMEFWWRKWKLSNVKWPSFWAAICCRFKSCKHTPLSSCASFDGNYINADNFWQTFPLIKSLKILANYQNGTNEIRKYYNPVF